jgi:hypothetical protein
VTWKVLTSITVKHVITPQYVFGTSEKNISTSRPTSYVSTKHSAQEIEFGEGEKGGSKFVSFFRNWHSTERNVVARLNGQGWRNNLYSVFGWGYFWSEQWGSWFDPTSHHVRFVVDKVALGEIFVWVLLFLPAWIIPPMLLTHVSITEAT